MAIIWYDDGGADYEGNFSPPSHVFGTICVGGEIFKQGKI